MIDIDKELEWVREDREDRHIGSISKHECVVDVDWVEELLAEVKRLREQLAKANKYVHSICQHSDSMLVDYEDYMKGDD